MRRHQFSWGIERNADVAHLSQKMVCHPNSLRLFHIVPYNRRPLLPSTDTTQTKVSPLSPPADIGAVSFLSLPLQPHPWQAHVLDAKRAPCAKRPDECKSNMATGDRIQRHRESDPAMPGLTQRCMNAREPRPVSVTSLAGRDRAYIECSLNNGATKPVV